MGTGSKGAWIDPILDAQNKKSATEVENPKDVIGSSKLPLHLWPASATAMGCLGMLDGAGKYGRNNFRVSGIRASVYVDACKRHLDAWFESEEEDPDSELPHLSHALATIAIIVEAIAKKNLIDDRNYPTSYRELIAELTKHVARLQKKHAEKKPKHWTIKDKK